MRRKLPWQCLGGWVVLGCEIGNDVNRIIGTARNGTSALVVKVYVNMENMMCAQRLPCARGREKRRVRCGRCGTAPRHEKSVSLLPAEPSLV